MSTFVQRETMLAFLFHARLSLVFKSFVSICLLSICFAFIYRLFSNRFHCVVLNACGAIRFCCVVEKDSGAHQLPEAVHPVPLFEGCS